MKRAKIIIVLGAVIALLTSVGVAMATTGATTGTRSRKWSCPRPSRLPTNSATC